MSVDRETLDRIRAMVADEATSREIGNALGLSSRTVLRLVRQQRLGEWCSANVGKSRIPETFAADYVAMTNVAAAEKYGRSLWTVYRWAQRLGLVTPRPRYAKVLQGNVKAFVARPAPVEPVAFVRKDAHMLAMPRSPLPAAPCFRCGARGFCGHDGRVDETAAVDARRAA